MLERAEFEAWEEKRPGCLDSLDAKVRWWTPKQIGPLVLLDASTGAQRRHGGEAGRVYARAEKCLRAQYFVAEPELQASNTKTLKQ